MPHLQVLQAEAVVAGVVILLDEVARLQGGKEAKDVVLVQGHAAAELGDPQLHPVAVELVQQVKGMADRLDEIVRLVPLCPHRHSPHTPIS